MSVVKPAPTQVSLGTGLWCMYTVRLCKQWTDFKIKIEVDFPRKTHYLFFLIFTVFPVNSDVVQMVL